MNLFQVSERILKLSTESVMMSTLRKSGNLRLTLIRNLEVLRNENPETSQSVCESLDLISLTLY